MIDVWAWIWWLWVMLMVYSVTLVFPDRWEKKDKTLCEKHPSTSYCACRNNLPTGKK